MCAASIAQAVRGIFRPCRLWLDGHPDYRIADSANQATITHLPTKTVLKVISSSGKQAMGLVGVPLAIADEPGAWEVLGGQLMHDALSTAMGKPDSPLRVLYIGTIAPSVGGWWPEMIERGTHGSTFVMARQGDRDKWDSWPEIRRCNPLLSHYADSRAVLLEERDEARGDTHQKAKFLSYRLNQPTPDESETLLTLEDWKLALARAISLPIGKPIVGIDLGANRAWSAAVAVWQSGRCEAMAVTPGIPDIEAQEKRDRVPKGTYRRLLAEGRLSVADGLRVVPASLLLDAVHERWGVPEQIVVDRFRLDDLKDTQPGCLIVPRVSRWSEASYDIRALRKMAKDGPLSVGASSRKLISASLSAAMVQPDDAGNVRMLKRGTNNQARDDVAAALVLGAGAWERAPKVQRSGWYLGAA